MKLSIIVVNWNTKNLLRQTIKSVLAEKNLDFEIILIDNNSSDGSVEMLQREFPSVRLVESKKNTGFAKANNMGLQIAQGEYLMLLNSDTLVLNGAIGKLVQFLEENKEVVMVGPKLLNQDGSFQLACRRNLPNLQNSFLYFFSPKWLFKDSKKYKTEENPNESRYTEAISGAVMLFRHSVYKKIGGLDERFFMYAEDLDYCKRIADLGWKIYYLSTAEIIHLGGQSSRQRVLKSKSAFYQSTWQYYQKHFYHQNSFLTNLFVLFGIKILFLKSFFLPFPSRTHNIQ